MPSSLVALRKNLLMEFGVVGVIGVLSGGCKCGPLLLLLWELVTADEGVKVVVCWGEGRGRLVVGEGAASKITFLGGGSSFVTAAGLFCGWCCK